MDYMAKPGKVNTPADAGPGRTHAPDTSKISLSRREYQYIAIASTAILMIIALLVIVFSLARNPTPLQRCKGIVYSSQRNSCIQDLAINTSNASTCAAIPAPYQYSCIDALAQNTNNATVCNMINNSMTSTDCIINLSISNENPYYCTTISNATLESDCIYSVSEKGYMTNESYCGMIQNHSGMEKCNYIYEFDRAMSQANGTYCSALPDAYTADAVQASTLIGSYPEISNPSFIFYTSLANLTDRQLCYAGLSQLPGNQSECYSLTGAAENLCLYGSVSPLSNNSTSANTINITQVCSSSNSTYSSICGFSSLLANASIDNNYTVCLSSPNNNYADLCLIYIATQYNDTGDCNYISNSSLRTTCISNVTKSN